MEEREAIRVLLVEDNPGDARLVQLALREVTDSPVTITRVERLGDGLRELERDGYDVLLLDLALPDSDSTETLARVRKLFPDMPTILLTGAEDDDFGLEAVRHGAADFLPKKDLDGRSLTRSLQYAVERKRIDDLRYKKERKRVLNYELRDMMESAATTRGVIMDKIDDIHHVIYGNDVPETGMLWRLGLVEAFKANVMKVVWAVGLAAATGVAVTLVKNWIAGQ